MRAQFVFGEVWVGLRRNLTMTIALIVVVAISLALLGTGMLFVKQVDKTRAFWQSRVELSVYLCNANSSFESCIKNGAYTPAEAAQIQSTLQRTSGVTSVRFVSQQQAYQQYKRLFPGDNFVQPGQIPASFQVRMANSEAYGPAVTNAVTGMLGVQNVESPSILTNLYRLLDGARNALILIAIVLIGAGIMLVANTIRLSAFNRRRETAIMRLVGASNFYVQLPFLMEGMIAGLCGWLISVGLLLGAKTLLLNGMQQYFNNFTVPLTTSDLVQVMVEAMLLGLVLCGATSFLTLRRYLRV